LSKSKFGRFPTFIVGRAIEGFSLTGVLWESALREKFWVVHPDWMRPKGCFPIVVEDRHDTTRA